MKKYLLRSVIATSTLLIGFQALAIPAAYNIAFNGDGSAASGQIMVDNGLAVSGFLNVTAGAAQGTYDLFTWTGGGISSVRVGGGTDLIVDNAVSVGSTPWLDLYGLAFVSADGNEGIDLSLNFGTTYNLGGFGPVGYYVPNANGDATITAVPDGGTTALLLGAGVAALALIPRKPSVVQTT